MNKKKQILDQIPANQRLVESLYAQGYIESKTREKALDFLYPRTEWSLWISRLFLIIGSALILSGVFFFFAFNWEKIPAFSKLVAILAGLLGCLVAAYIYTLQNWIGQIFLVAASLLVGVFLSVYAQSYQTDMQMYQFTLIWSLIILCWTLFSNFAAQWIFWLAVTNLFLGQWWDQSVKPTYDLQYFIYTFLIILNGTAFALREYLSRIKNIQWAKPNWIQAVLLMITLLVMFMPSFVLLSFEKFTPSILVSGGLGLIGHGAMFYYFRYKQLKIWALTITLLSCCLLAEAFIFNVISQLLPWARTVFFLFVGLATLGIFSTTVMYIRRIADKQEKINAQ